MLTECEFSAIVRPHNTFRINKLTPSSISTITGPSTPTKDHELSHFKTSESEKNLVPPERPQSTPFPVQEINDRHLHCPYYHFNDIDDEMKDVSAEHVRLSIKKTGSAPLHKLPIEIHEFILDYLLGVRESSALSASSTGKAKFIRGSALRHSRRQEVSQLALVSRTWRRIIQERMYRHIKIRGTRSYINDAIDWFKHHSHLKSYIRHIDIWFPVFQQKNIALDPARRIASTSERSLLSFYTSDDYTIPVSYQSPSDNSTLEQVFRFIQNTFDRVCILTLEGGERKKPPMVRYFQKYHPQNLLPELPSVRTLVCKGQWNIIRSNSDFENLAKALPNLTEWHAFYSKPKSKSYLSMATILPKLPHHLTHLNICLEADYRREAFIPEHAKKVRRKTHFCIEMARAIPTLEHLAYTGRICHEFFNTAALLSDPRESRLKTVDIVVKNVCRPSVHELGWGDGSIITDMKFISAFENLVVAALRSLERLAMIELLKIRFIDLESQIPGLNPYFQYNKEKCTGIWSDSIVESLYRSRPAAFFVEKPEILDDMKIGQIFANASFYKSRPLCINVSHYACLVSGINIT
ncbi:hypothetical protein EPUL_002137 [Erysiphe pulchra]|uniref:Uncharacterized protein n=1 Tax=Erysiphe pulchra TaxID=225359 RepID=A0A2S4PT07_9PEZI|nr:hypothetical protein EPUL_002137 [Erysiphe pulchra]